MIQVSNGPYGTTTGGITSRPRLDTGKLGVFSLVVPDAVSATRAIAALTTATPALYEGYLSWETPVFEVDSAAPIAVGLDGESLEMDPPLVFSVAAGRAPPAAAAAGDRLFAGRAGHGRQGAVGPVARRARASRAHRRLRPPAARSPAQSCGSSGGSRCRRPAGP